VTVFYASNLMTPFSLASQRIDLLLFRLGLTLARKGLLRVSLSVPHPSPQDTLHHPQVTARLDNRNPPLLHQLNRFELELAAEYPALHDPDPEDAPGLK
jgi:hypothetical protein